MRPSFIRRFFRISHGIYESREDEHLENLAHILNNADEHGVLTSAYRTLLAAEKESATGAAGIKSKPHTLDPKVNVISLSLCLSVYLSVFDPASSSASKKTTYMSSPIHGTYSLSLPLHVQVARLMIKSIGLYLTGQDPEEVEKREKKEKNRRERAQREHREQQGSGTELVLGGVGSGSESGCTSDTTTSGTSLLSVKKESSTRTELTTPAAAASHLDKDDEDNKDDNDMVL